MKLETARKGITKILVIADECERMGTLQALVRLDEVRIDSASNFEEVRRRCETAHDLVLVDVKGPQLTQILNCLRNSPTNREIPVLVNVERTAADSSLAGILPRFRAMPCTPTQMGKFTRGQFANHPRRPNENIVL